MSFVFQEFLPTEGLCSKSRVVIWVLQETQQLPEAQAWLDLPWQHKRLQTRTLLPELHSLHLPLLFNALMNALYLHWRPSSKSVIFFFAPTAASTMSTASSFCTCCLKLHFWVMGNASMQPKVQRFWDSSFQARSWESGIGEHCSRGLLVASWQRILEFLLSSIKLWRKLASSVEVFVLVSAHSRMMLSLRFSQRILLLHSLLVVIDQALEKVGFVTSTVKQMSKRQLWVCQWNDRLLGMYESNCMLYACASDCTSSLFDTCEFLCKGGGSTALQASILWHALMNSSIHCSSIFNKVPDVDDCCFASLCRIISDQCVYKNHSGNYRVVEMVCIISKKVKMNLLLCTTMTKSRMRML